MNFLLATFNISPFLTHKYEIFLVSHDWSHGVKEEGRLINLSGTIYQRMHILSVRRAKINIANSQFTASETLKFTDMQASVVYHDCDPFYKTKGQFKDGRGVIPTDGDYILYVGRVRPAYKNIHSLLETFNHLRKEKKELKLVIVSSDDFTPYDSEFIRKNKINLIHLKKIVKEEVRELYMNAWVTVYPSIYEGFGSPLLEAQASGSPLIATHCGPIPEVAGNGAIYFDGSSLHLLQKLEEMDANIRNDLIRKGKENVNRFSWKQTAQEIKYLISQGIPSGTK